MYIMKTKNFSKNINGGKRSEPEQIQNRTLKI